jgi:hypothetical protein
VWSADAVIVVGGSWGTLSELALAKRRGGVPVVSVGGWRLVAVEGEDVAEVEHPANDLQTHCRSRSVPVGALAASRSTVGLGVVCDTARNSPRCQVRRGHHRGEATLGGGGGPLGCRAGRSRLGLIGPLSSASMS